MTCKTLLFGMEAPVCLSAEHLVGALLIGFVGLVIFVGVQIWRGKINIIGDL